MTTALRTVHVRINDAATGQPTPVRLRITDPDGTYFAPFGRLTAFATGPNQDVGGNLRLGAKAYAYIDGTCEVRLPAGLLHVEIHKGPEYQSQHLEVRRGAGQAALRFTVPRWLDLRAEGWYAGDSRAHFLTPHAALLEAQAEDVAVVNLLATACRVPGPEGREYPALPNLLAFSGQHAALEKPGHLVVVNTHNRHPVLGSLALLNCHRIVFPLHFGGPDGHEDWSLADWCDQCHRKGGLVVWTRVGHETPDFVAGEALADLVLGKVDALELSSFEDVLADWYGLLDGGLRVPLVGGSGKDSNGVALGAVRTYARLPAGEPLTYGGWIEAVRAGRTFVTSGPLLAFTVEGRDPGTVLDRPASGPPVRFRAEARSQVPFERLEVLANGTVLASAAASGTPAAATLEAAWVPGPGGWLAARCWGSPVLSQGPANRGVCAHTSPVYVQVAGQTPPPAAHLDRLLAQLDRMLDWVNREGRFENESQRDHLLGIFRAAREELGKRRGS